MSSKMEDITSGGMNTLGQQLANLDGVTAAVSAQCSTPPERTSPACTSAAAGSLSSPSLRRPRSRCPRNICRNLHDRLLRGNSTDLRKMHLWAESTLVSHPGWVNVQLPPNTRSTISLSFSPSGRMFASTHGDHTVKIISTDTGRIARELHGHPRTPWTVKFHPTDPNIVASGCLSGHIIVWDVSQGVVLCRHFEDRPIISLAFHPDGDVIGIAAGKSFSLWNYRRCEVQRVLEVSTSLRAVMFLKTGAGVIIGQANALHDVPARLRDQAEEPSMKRTIKIIEYPIVDISNLATAICTDRCRLIVRHAVLYNDGGMDVSSCGTRLICCMYQPESQRSSSACASTDKKSSSPRSTRELESLPPGSFSLGLPSTPTQSNPRASRNPHTPPPATAAGTSADAAAAASGSPTPASKCAGAADAKDRAHGSKSPDAENRNHPEAGEQLNPVQATRTSPALNASPLRRRIIGRPPHIRRRVRQRIERPRLPLFQLAMVGLEDHNHGAILSYKTIAWTTARGTTSVKFSPSSSYILVGYGVRSGSGHSDESAEVIALFRVAKERLEQVRSMSSHEDDLNISLFDPHCGGSFVFGTKQGLIKRVDIRRRSASLEPLSLSLQQIARDEHELEDVHMESNS